MNVGLFLKGTSVQKFVFEDELNSQITDIELVCTDGKINAHKIILLSRSVHFQEALQRNPGTTSISFSTINRDGMKMVLRVIYGEVVKLPEGDPYKLLEALKFLKVNYWVQFEKFRLGLGSSDDSKKKKQKKKPKIVFNYFSYDAYRLLSGVSNRHGSSLTFR